MSVSSLECRVQWLPPARHFQLANRSSLWHLFSTGNAITWPDDDAAGAPSSVLNKKVLSTCITRRAAAHERIAEPKRQTGNDILVVVSHTLWHDLLANDLVDELHLRIGPVV